MHNCKTTREQMIDAAMGQSMQGSLVLEELERCPACRKELASLRSLLRVTDQVIESTSPPENFWPGYHARLEQFLERETAPPFRPSVENAARARLRRLFTTSIRLPIPLAAVLLVLFGLSLAFATQSRRRADRIPNANTVTKTVEVPVIQERTVTRVVYRDRRRINTGARRMEQLARTGSRVWGRLDEPAANTPISLVGFRPTSDPKLTIIKGSYRDEK